MQYINGSLYHAPSSTKSQLKNYGFFFIMEVFLTNNPDRAIVGSRSLQFHVFCFPGFRMDG